MFGIPGLGGMERKGGGGGGRETILGFRKVVDCAD